MTVKQAQSDGAVMAQWIALSQDREREGSCHGYRSSGPADIEGNRANLHFYIDELGMEFWSARLCKRLKEG